MDGDVKRVWVTPMILRTLTEREIEDEMRGSDLRVYGMGNFDIAFYTKTNDQPVPE